MKTENDRKNRNVLAALIIFLGSFVLLLVMSYGFPVNGDDWRFAAAYLNRTDSAGPLRVGWEIAVKHYQTTNGRVLGNFLVSFAMSGKFLRELIRCGIILGIILCVYRLSGWNGIKGWLLCFALLIALPASILAQTYAWAAGFFNYVPPALCFLLYALYLRRVLVEGKRSSRPVLLPALFFLGLASQFFVENFTLGLLVISVSAFIADWVMQKRICPGLLAHLAGAVLGTVLMFLAPGYSNVGSEGYRELSLSPSDLLGNLKTNFKTLAGLLTGHNLLLIILLCAAGAAVCLRVLPGVEGKRRAILRACVPAYAFCPVMFYGIRTFGNYYLLLDMAVCVIFLMAIVLTALFAVEDRQARFALVLCTGAFVICFAPLMIVHPVGPRNDYFFDVLLIADAVILLRQAVRELPVLRPMGPALCLICVLLLAGNLWILTRNGNTERLRTRIIEEAMERGQTSITLPDYPYSAYVHSPRSNGIQTCYFYEKHGDITFEYVTYKEWIETH